MEYEEILLIKTAWYYYFEDLTQQQISEILGISRMRVIKLLEKARKNGIVQFKIRSEHAKRMGIEAQLAEKYGLKDTFIVPSNPDKSKTNETIAKAAAMYIHDRLTKNTFINVGYGDTCSRVLAHLTTIADTPLSCVALTGGVNYYLPYKDSNRFNAKLYLVPSPLIASTKEVAAVIKEEPSVLEISRMALISSMTVVGIGSMKDNATIIKSGILNKNDLLFLKGQGVKGDILCHFVDKNGKLVNAGFEERLITTPVETLNQLQNVIGVAAGSDKIGAIRAVLKGKFLNILITDEQTAIDLLSD